MIPALGYAAHRSFSRLKPLAFGCENPRDDEVQIDIPQCGVCHSDIHQCENDWGNKVYPCMPGHEIVGRVVAAGPAVTKQEVGDLVGVGCMIDSCRACAPCRQGEERYRQGPNSWLATDNGPMTPAAKTGGAIGYGRDTSFGGYPNAIVVREDFVLRVPDAIPLQAAAPILCAGVTTYSPMKHFGARPGSVVGVVGLGGLGDMAVKIATAMGAAVTVFEAFRLLHDGEPDPIEALTAGALQARLASASGDADQVRRRAGVLLKRAGYEYREGRGASGAHPCGQGKAEQS